MSNIHQMNFSTMGRYRAVASDHGGYGSFRPQQMNQVSTGPGQMSQLFAELLQALQSLQGNWAKSLGNPIQSSQSNETGLVQSPGLSSIAAVSSGSAGEVGVQVVQQSASDSRAPEVIDVRTDSEGRIRPDRTGDFRTDSEGFNPADLTVEIGGRG